MVISRRRFLEGLVLAAAGGATGCVDSARYTDEDVAQLNAQRETERARSGTGPFGEQRFRGYRGLAELPWFELDGEGRLRCIAEELPPAFDAHTHLGMSLLFAPEIDLQARTERVRHLLDCDGTDPGCELDLDVYINANFTPADLRALRWGAVAQLLWGSSAAATHTVPNLLAEMDATGVERALVLPIAFGLPFGDDLTERFMQAIRTAGAEARLVFGASVHHSDAAAVEKLEGYASAGARAVKLHPAGQRFYPDSDNAMRIYEACGRLGMAVFFHAGRAGIEPEYTHQFTVMRNYEEMLRRFPEVNFILGHAGARDFKDAVPLARKYPNAWMEIHGQGVTRLHELIEHVGHDRLLFGTDWPFYHLAATLAKVLIVTEGRPDIRFAILRGNADRLFVG